MPHLARVGEGGGGVRQQLGSGQHRVKGKRLKERRARELLAVGATEEGLRIGEGEAVDAILRHPVPQRVKDLGRMMGRAQEDRSGAF